MSLDFDYIRIRICVERVPDTGKVLTLQELIITKELLENEGFKNVSKKLSSMLVGILGKILFDDAK